ncbi:hypothetical protein DFJ58DRAFT_765820 [Suillus subalutaceus]|uniref:uncharacterized protein n=1 Tax=Suillus subalutaceus TaxID=48586 RepID=UPI001B884D80|nr:uncharacterized protein DFJ58DRAFT_765820 [Suillus subalutaceus]KAG1869390.1 hypothetical protein DFJ58DRAFT_765820 [Suillus subalutaceus]
MYLWSSQDIEPLSEHEARQFLRHAARVRSLHVGTSKLFRLLANLSIEICVFPSLFSLFFMVDHPHAKYLRLFLSPTLRQCHLSVMHPDFKYIATHFTVLEHLSIELRPVDDSIADDLLLLYNSIRSCKKLATLCCPPLDWAAWRHISNLPTLLTVEINEPCRAPPSHWPLGRDTHNFAPFCNLTGLFFYVDTAAYTIAIIQHSELPSLQDFVMNVSVLPYTEAEQLCRALSQCKADQNLKHIDITARGAKVGELSSSSLTVITQFFGFTQLRTLQLEFPHCCFNLDNNLLLGAMTSWPHICSLELLDIQTLPTVTFRGLFTALLQSESFQHTTLESLKLTRSPVTDAEAVARILFSMLPRIDQVLDQRVSVDSWNIDLYLQQWDEVNRHLDLLNGREPRNSEFE